jgi:hypothetical protein
MRNEERGMRNEERGKRKMKRKVADWRFGNGV